MSSKSDMYPLLINQQSASQTSEAKLTVYTAEQPSVPELILVNLFYTTGLSTPLSV